MSDRTDTVTIDRTDLAQLEHLIETLQEATTDTDRFLTGDDRGWSTLDQYDDQAAISRSEIRHTARLGRVMAIHDPLIRRGVELCIAYVWGQGVEVAASQGDHDGDQDVNAVIQAFWEDQETTFTGAQACEERERALKTDGNVFLSLPTDPLTGRVQVRTIPDSQVDDVLTDPEDAETPWLYKRTFTQTAVQPARDRVTGALTSLTRSQTRTVWYPALGYRPAARAKTLDGYPIEWDKPVLHVRVNRPSGSKWGTPDLTAALPWARGYAEGLVDWAKLIKALSRFAFRATAKNKTGAAQVRSRIETGPDNAIGGVAITPEGHTFEAIGKTGATIDSRSFMPLAAQVAAALGVPATMLTADPGVTGARATAETLDQPLRLTTRRRRDLNAWVIRAVLNHVIDSAIKAPRGPLRGTVTIDPATGHERVELAGGQARGIDIDWPTLDEVDLATLMDALVKADSLGYLPPDVIVRLVLLALDVDNPDEVLEQLLDDDGNFLYPADTAAARSALAAVGAGRYVPDDDGQ